MNIGYWTCENCGGCTDHHESDDDGQPACNHCGDDLFDREYTPMPPAAAAASAT